MANRRIIPCLDVHDGRVTRGEQFGLAERGELTSVGDPLELALRYGAEGADELVLYDITATAEGRGVIADLAAQVAASSKIPLTVGGGVSSLADVQTLVRAGASKVSLNSGAVARPELITEAADLLGSQAVVLSIDFKRDGQGGWPVFVAGGRRSTGLHLVEWAERAQALGAGELVLNSIDGDGMKSGYDLAAIEAVVAAVDIPVVASGGAGSAADMRDALLVGADAALAAGIFHRGEVSIRSVKDLCRAAGLPMSS